MRLLKVAVLISLLLLALLILYQMKLGPPPRFHRPYVVYAPHWFANTTECEIRTWDNMTHINADLDLVKEMGFYGIKLFNIEPIHWEGPGPGRVMLACEDRGLRVTIALRVWRQEQFPENKTAIGQFKDFLSEAIPLVRNSSALVAYIVHYPVNYTDIWAYGQKWFHTTEYKRSLEEIIGHLYSLDPSHPIWMSLEFDPEFNAPLDLCDVEAYGIQPYSWHTPSCYDKHKTRKYLQYFEQRGLQHFIDEYGVQTNNASLSGYAYNETVKARVVKAFIYDVFGKGYTSAYFALFDTSQADWGLAFDNRTLKESGLQVKDILATMRRPP